MTSFSPDSLMNPLPLDILHQDDYLVAINKPAGHLTHPADIPEADHLVCLKILRDQLGQHIYNIHRLDRPTCGVLLFGLDKKASAQTQRLFEQRQVHKRYHAVINASPAQNEWDCHEPLQKNETAPLKDAHTSFRLLKTHPEKELTLLEATLHTGRYHQIRRHLLHAGHPIVGDYRYAGIETSDRLGQELGTGTRMLLQANSLTLTHPISGETLNLQAPPEPLIESLFEPLDKATPHPTYSNGNQSR